METEPDNLISSSVDPIDPVPKEWMNHQSARVNLDISDRSSQTKESTEQASNEGEINILFQSESNKHKPQNTPHSDHEGGSDRKSSLYQPTSSTLEPDDQITTESEKGNHWATPASVSVHAEPYSRTDPPEDNLSSLLAQFIPEDTQPKRMLSVDTETMDSPTPTATATALCKYRWYKTVNTNSTDVGFYSSFTPNSPVLLTWNETAEVYYSDNVRIECGDYNGNLVVGGNIYPVEEFSVRSYTFEVDLYLKDDISSEANIAGDIKLTPGDSKTVRSNQESNLNYDDLTRQQFPSINKMNGDINEIGSLPVSQPFLTSMKRDSPIGDVDSGHFYEFSSTRTNNESNSTERYSDISKQYKRDSLEKTHLSETRKLDLVEDILSRPPSTLLSRDGEMPTLKRANSFSGSRSSSGSIAAYSTLPESSNQDLHNDALSLGSSNRPSSVALRPDSRAEFSSLELTKTAPTTDQRLSSSQTQLSYREISTNQLQWSKGSSGRSTPQADTQADSLTIYPERSASQLSGRPPSNVNSRASSRTTSVVSIGSEQELGQYIVNSTRDKSSAVGNSPISGEFNKDTQIFRGSDRASSLPNYQPQHLVKLEGRSVTPDNKIRVPPADLSTFRNGLVTERMEDVLGRASSQSSLASRGSSRSATPVASDFGQREIGVAKIQDLEASVSNLRKLLTNREAEVHSLIAQVTDLKDINRSLREDLEHKSHRHSSSLVVQDSLEYKQLQREKEILASEVVLLREQIERLSRGQTPGSGRNSVSSGITDYSPNSPIVLQRKIADLEAHMKDLQEVTESTTANLVRTENTLKHLEQENKDLRARSLGHTELMGNNELKNLRVEMRALQEDYRSIKERNLHLTEENMRLVDEQKKRLKERDQSGTELSRFSSSLKTENGSRHLQDYPHSNYKSELSDPAHSLGSEKTNYTSLTSRILSERDVQHTAQNHSYENERKVSDSSRLLHQRNSMESSRLRASGKDAKPSDYLRAGMNYPDRSRPDGEVSEIVYTDKYLKKSDDPRDRELVSSSYLDKHYAALKDGNFLGDQRHRDDYEDNLKEDKYRYTKDNAHDVDSKLSSRHLTSTGPISSKDIFLNLQSRTRKWLNEVDSDQKVKQASDSDSDSTEVLMKRSLLRTKHKAEIQEKNSNTSTSSIVSKPVKDEPNLLFTNDNKYISGNLDFNRYKPSGHLIDDTGDDSDTATDILLAQDTAPQGASKRRPSLGSDGTSSTLSDGDDDNLLRRRSKSVETSRSKESLSSRHLSSMPRGAPTARSVTSLDSMRQSAGLRSVLPPPLVTQHNKGELTNKNTVTSLLNSSLTQGLRPFAPRNIADIRIDDVVKFSRVGGKLTQGVVKYVGHLPGRSEAYLGVELDKDEGKHDGTFESIRYFKCKPNKGVFVAFNKVVMAWAP